MKTLEKNPTRTMRSNMVGLYNPWSRLSKNDFLDFWDGGFAVETVPSINIAEEKDQYKLEMAVPGLKKEDFNIDIEGNIITISCEKNSGIGDKENGNSGYWHKEYSYLSFSRSFTLPDYADTSRIIAKYNDGVLNLTLAKKPEAHKNKNQKITVQ